MDNQSSAGPLTDTHRAQGFIMIVFFLILGVEVFFVFADGLNATGGVFSLDISTSK